PKTNATAPATIPIPSGQAKLRFSASNEVLRHASSGPTPVRNSRNSAIGMFTLLKNGGPTLILLPVTHSDSTGKSVPQSTAKHAAKQTTRTTARNPTNHPPIDDSANACTELTIPARVRNVPRMHSMKVVNTSQTFHTLIIPRFSCIITECRNAVPVIHGSSDAFSTGSHSQYPPQPSTEYAQCAPSMMPTVW